MNLRHSEVPRFYQRREESRANRQLHSTRDPSLRLKNGTIRDDAMRQDEDSEVESHFKSSGPQMSATL